MKRSRLLGCSAALLLACPAVATAAEAVLAKGSQALVVAETPLKVGGKAIRSAGAGEQFTVLATNAAQGLVFVSLVGSDGRAMVASLPIGSVVAVDAAAGSPVPAGTPLPTEAANAAPPPVAGPPKPGADGSYPAIDVAKFFKSNRAAATAHFAGKPLKVTGSVERAEVQLGSDAPVVIFSTAQGLPKIKLQVHPSVSHDSTFYRGATVRSWYYDGWYTLGHRLEFRPAGSGLEARFKYRRPPNASSSTAKTWSDWFAFLSPGEVLTGAGTCKGLLMDVVVEATELSRPSQ